MKRIIRIRAMTTVFALSGSGCLALAALLPTAAQAQSAATAVQPADAGTEIVVTAQRRNERQVDVPITVTTLGADQLATANVNQLSDTAKLTPGLRFDTQGPAMQPTIRGVGTAITTSGGGPNVGIYVDGFFQPNTYVSDFQLLRVSSIQVLKGPQGTLFGRNTTGGAILVTSADPSTHTSAEFKATYGRFNALTLQGYATTGLTQDIAFDIEGQYRRSDGFVTNSAGNGKIGKSDSWSLRTGLKFNFSDNVSLLLRYTHAYVSDPTTQLTNAFVDTSGDANFFKLVANPTASYGRTSSQGLPLVYLSAPAGTFRTTPGQVTLNGVASFKAKSDTGTATFKADLGIADLTSYTQYRKDDSPYFGDLDATSVAPGTGPFFNIFVGVKDTTFSQELLLNSKPGGRLQWTAGANYFEYRDTWSVGADFGTGTYGPFGGSTTKTKSIAAFLDATYQLTDSLFVTAGGRFSHDVVTDASFNTNPFTTSYLGPLGQTIPFAGAPGTAIPVADLKNNKFTPRVVIRYKPDSQSSLYASYTKGYKAGILNVGGLSQQPIQPENIDAFEAGYKFDNRTLSVELAGYYYNYKNLQVSSFQNGAAQIRNAASSRIYGLEAQFNYRITPAFTVNGGGAWTHARYKSFTNAPFYGYCDPAATFGVSAVACLPAAFGGFPGEIVQGSTDASGYHMQRSPEFTANLGASYDLDVASGKLTLSGNLYYTSSFYFDPEQQFKQGGYALLSLRAQWTDPSKHYTLAVFGDNVTNKRYQSQVLFTTLGTGAVWSSPATYGISAGVKF